MFVFVIAGLLVCMEAPGSDAGTRVFVQRGEDLRLDVTNADVLEGRHVVSWSFNKTFVLVRFLPGREPAVSPVYSGRVELAEKTSSVKLKNLQQSDSGVYTAYVTGAREEQTTEYDVEVQDPVCPVQLTVSNSSDSCNLNVTCSTTDSHAVASFTCDTRACSEQGGGRSDFTSSAASLHVYLDNESIVCNHSNKVSWATDIITIGLFCPQSDGSDCLSAGFSRFLVKAVGLIVMASAVISVHLLEKFKKPK